MSIKCNLDGHTHHFIFEEMNNRMNSVLIITLLAATVIAVAAQLNFPRPDYYGAHQASVVNVSESEIVLPPELKEIMNHDRSPAKNVYDEIYIPLADATEDQIEIIVYKLLIAFLYPALPLAPEGFHLYLMWTSELGGFTRYIYSDAEYHLYALV